MLLMQAFALSVRVYKFERESVCVWEREYVVMCAYMSVLCLRVCMCICVCMCVTWYGGYEGYSAR